MTDGQTTAPLDGLALQFGRERPQAFAKALVNGAPEERDAVLAALPTEVVAPVVNALPQPVAVGFLAARSDAEVASLLSEQTSAQSLQLFARLPGERRHAVLEAVTDRRLRSRLRRLGSFAAETVGSIAELDVRWVAAEASVADAVAQMRSQVAQKRSEPAGDQPTVVVDAEHRVVGLLDTAQILRLEADARVAECVVKVQGLRAETTIGTAVDAPGWQMHRWLPVTDREQRLVGLLEHERLLGSVPRAEAVKEPTEGVIPELTRTFFAVSEGLLDALIGERGAS